MTDLLRDPYQHRKRFYLDLNNEVTYPWEKYFRRSVGLVIRVNRGIKDLLEEKSNLQIWEWKRLGENRTGGLLHGDRNTIAHFQTVRKIVRALNSLDRYSVPF
jgi:hypothetical protein